MTVRPLPARTAGSGARNLVLVHGWGFHSGCWEPLSRALDGEYACHLVELPGHGGAPGLRPYDTYHLVGALEGALPERIDGLVGCSMGGLLSLTLALRRPDLEFPLVMTSSMPTLSAGGNSAFSASWGMASAVCGEALAEAAGAAAALLGGRRPAAGKLTSKVRLLRKRPMASPAGLWLGLQWMKTHDVTKDLGSLKRRTLVIHGTADRVIPAESGLLLARKIPGAQLEIFEGATHSAFLDEPERFARVVREFLDESAGEP